MIIRSVSNTSFNKSTQAPHPPSLLLVTNLENLNENDFLRLGWFFVLLCLGHGSTVSEVGATIPWCSLQAVYEAQGLLCSTPQLQAGWCQTEQTWISYPSGGEKSCTQLRCLPHGVNYVDFWCKFYFRAGFMVLRVSFSAFWNFICIHARALSSLLIGFCGISRPGGQEGRAAD